MAEYFAQPEPYPHPPLQPDGSSEPRPDEMPQHAHESTDVKIRPLLITGVVTVVFIVFTVFFIIFVFNVLGGGYSIYQPHASEPVSAVKPVKVPNNAPRLQGIPSFNDRTELQEMADFREANRRHVTSYGVSADGTAHIPVSRAMELAIERQIFKTAAAPAAKPAELPAPGAHAPAHDTPQAVKPVETVKPAETEKPEVSKPEAAKPAEEAKPVEEKKPAAEEKKPAEATKTTEEVK